MAENSKTDEYEDSMNKVDYGDEYEEAEVGGLESVVDPELEAMQKRVLEMEKEAQRLREVEETLSKGAGEEGGEGTEAEDGDARSIYVGNVDYVTTPEELQEHFKGSGSINRVTILCDKFTGHPKGYGYVEFAAVDAVTKAQLLDGSMLHGRALKVNPKRTNVPGLNRGRGRGRGRGYYGYAPRGRGFRGRQKKQKQGQRAQGIKELGISAHTNPQAATMRIDTAPDAIDAAGPQIEKAAKAKGDEAPIARIMHGSVDSAMRARLAQPDAEEAFFVADLGEVYRQLTQWSRLLPRVQPFYAVKCNPDPLVLKLLARAGAGFDCASRWEIQQALGEGVAADNIVYAHPCKPASHLRFARDAGVAMMTFDNADELVKISQLYPGARAILRILTDDSSSLCQLGLKFGASLDTTEALLATARRLGIDVVGVSFHVGSGCKDEAAFGDAVLRARRVFDQGEAAGFRFSVLDIGGGFPGRRDQSGLSFATVAAVLADALDTHFPRVSHGAVRIIAEPGRYFVASAFTLAVNVVARRVVHSEPPAFMYYVNDGVYGSFNCIMFDHQHPRPRVLTCAGLPAASAAPEYPCSVWGPTCDSIDCIVPSGLLPELHIGDWLAFDGMGAYTVCAASRFNGFAISDVVYVDTEGVLL
ncbi:Ornithine decarboxylase [Coemansia sp. RSA 1933]|nr:Ornithine decarboxylase [Coemansia sp. RSA 1933]